MTNLLLIVASLAVIGAALALKESVERVINGTRVAKGPLYQVYIGSACGGSIIKSNVILTAAHCIDLSAPTIEINFGVVDRSDPAEEGWQIMHLDTKYVKVHEHFQHVGTVLNDIALIILPVDIQFDGFISSIPLPSNASVFLEEPEIGSKAKVSGWGKTADGNFSLVLQEAQLTIISNEECKKHYPQMFFTPAYICGKNTELQQAAKGDSGGPLVSYGGQGALVGITSFGSPGKPEIFTRVSYYLDWIRKNIGYFNQV